MTTASAWKISSLISCRVARGANCRSLEYQPSESLRHVKVWLWRASRLPREIAAVRIFADAAKQIQAPTLAFLWRVNPMIPGNAHRDPEVTSFDHHARIVVQVGGDRHA